MDSLTHIALGSCLGTVLLGKKWGLPAVGWGLAAASLPDIDAVAGPFLTLPEELIAHRGITHSFLFAFIVAAIPAAYCQHRYRNRGISLFQFYGFFLLQIVIHDLLDTCNAYGTGLLEPFSAARFSFHNLYVADPLISIWIIAAAVIILLNRRNFKRQLNAARVGLGLMIFFLCISVINKLVVKSFFEKSLRSQAISPTDYFITPTPFNSLLWYAVAKSPDGYHIGHLSVFDDKSEPVPLTFFPQNDSLLSAFPERSDISDLKRFADDFYTVEKWNDTLVFNVLRFGQMIGWQQPKAHFAFYYFLDENHSNDLVVQRGRFEGWNRQTLGFMLRRIGGSIEDFGDRLDDKKKPAQ